jgi:tetratricopeptide (TPR) repeat protein
MTLISRVQMSRSSHPSRWQRFVRWLVLIPEAPLVSLMVLLAWLLHFPPSLGLFATAIVIWFFVRSGLLLLAEHRLAQGDLRPAGKIASLALRMYPWSADALLLVAQIKVHQGDHAEADTLLDQAARLDVACDDVGAVRAANLLAQGVAPEPAAFPLPTDGPVSPALLHHHAHHALHVEYDPARAVDLLRRTDLQRLPPSTSVPLLLLLAESYIALEQHADARDALTRCKARLDRCARPQQAEALYYLGRLWHTLGEDGRPYFRRSVELDPAGRYAHAAWRSAVTETVHQ